MRLDSGLTLERVRARNRALSRDGDGLVNLTQLVSRHIPKELVVP